MYIIIARVQDKMDELRIIGFRAIDGVSLVQTMIKREQ